VKSYTAFGSVVITSFRDWSLPPSPPF